MNQSNGFTTCRYFIISLIYKINKMKILDFNEETNFNLKNVLCDNKLKYQPIDGSRIIQFSKIISFEKRATMSDNFIPMYLLYHRLPWIEIFLQNFYESKSKIINQNTVDTRMSST